MEQVQFRNYLIALRKTKGLQQKELAALLYVSPQAVSKWEVGSSIPDISQLLAIANLYRISLDTLFSSGEIIVQYTTPYYLDTIKLGKYIARLRKKKDISQNTLAETICVSPQAVSKWETGRGIPDIAQLISIADYFSITIDDLMKYGEDLVFVLDKNGNLVQQKPRKHLWSIVVPLVSLAFCLGVVVPSIYFAVKYKQKYDDFVNITNSSSSDSSSSSEESSSVPKEIIKF